MRWDGRIIIAFILSAVPGFPAAATLSEVYHQALKVDAAYQVATAQYLAAREQVPLAQAELLPDIDAVASVTETHNDRKRPDSVSTTVSRVYSISFTQPLLDVAQWHALSEAKASVRSARATFESASQDLIIRVAQAYFLVLERHDVLRFSQAQSKTLLMQKRQTQARFEVGLDALTDVQEVNAQYHSAVAAELAAANALGDALENLRMMTDRQYDVLAALPQDELPLLSPKPAKVGDWVKQSIDNNQLLMAAQADAQAAHQAVLGASADHLPTLSATGSYTYTHETDSTVSGYSVSQVPKVGVSLSLPVYSGGSVNAATRQAAHDEAAAQAQVLQVKRQVVNATRQAYFDIFSGVSQIRATRQAVISGETALEAMQAAYGVGTRDLTDVLLAQGALYAAQKDDAKQHYAYLMSMLLLRQAAGVLKADDLEQVTSWLTHSIAVPEEMVQHMMVTAANIDVGDKPVALDQPVMK